MNNGPMSPDPQAGPAALAGRSAVVTGSSSGIGRAIAERMAAAGADVLVHARQNRGGAEQTAAAIREQGREAHLVLADLCDPVARDRLVEQAFAWRPIDIWVNNAGADVLTGLSGHQDFLTKLESLWRTDVLATVALGRQVGQQMRARGGVMINMGWDQADWGMEGDSGQLFGIVKGAIMAFSKSLAKSLAPSVRVNCLAPGWIRTRWAEHASVDWQQRGIQESLMERWGTPEDVAHMACFVASDAASFLTGQVLYINGGFRGTGAPPRDA